jgi:hypothetical protein
MINQGRPFLRSIQLNWSVLARIIPLASRRGGRSLLLSLTSIQLSSVAGELLDEVLQWSRNGSIPTDVDSGFLAQNQTQQCFEDIAATRLTFAIFAARIVTSRVLVLASRQAEPSMLLAPLFDYE